MSRYTLLIGLITFYLSNCLDSSSNIGKRIEFRFFVSNIGNEIYYGSDSVRVREIKFTSTAFKITNEDSVELGNPADFNRFLYAYSSLGDTDVIILSSDLGFELNGFTDFELDIGPVDTRDPFFDNDFYGSDDVIYSFVIDGTVNGSDFLFRATPDFIKKFTSEVPVTISDSQETLFLRTELDIRALFDDGNGGLLNPTETEVRSQILTNFRNQLSGEMVAGSIVNFD